MKIESKFEVGDQVAFIHWQFGNEITGIITQIIMQVKKNNTIEILYEVTGDMVFRVLEEKLYKINDK